MKLATLAAQADGDTVRVEEARGDSYLVAPSILIREGVLKGTYVDFAEIAASEPFWNGRPVTAPPGEGATAATIPPADAPPSGHPLDEQGEFASANQPPYLDDMKVGHIRNAEALPDEKALRAELWLNMRLVESVGQHALTVAQHVAEGEPLDVSTGYWYAIEPTPGTYNGESYTEAAHDIVPDHLATLPTETGACSWEDGCGVPRMNQAGDDGAAVSHILGAATDGDDVQGNANVDDISGEEAQSRLARIASLLPGGGSPDDNESEGAAAEGCGGDCGEGATNTNSDMTNVDIDALADATAFEADRLHEMDDEDVVALAESVDLDGDGDGGADDTSGTETESNATETGSDDAPDVGDVMDRLDALSEEVAEVKNRDPEAERRRSGAVETITGLSDYEPEDLEEWPTQALVAHAEVLAEDAALGAQSFGPVTPGDRVNAVNYGPGAGAQQNGADDEDDDDLEWTANVGALQAADKRGDD